MHYSKRFEKVVNTDFTKNLHKFNIVSLCFQFCKWNIFCLQTGLGLEIQRLASPDLVFDSEAECKYFSFNCDLQKQ